MYEDKEIEEHIRKNKDNSNDIIKEVCAIFIPSVKQLFRVLRKNGIFIDTQDKHLKDFIRKCYFLANEKGFSDIDRLNYFGLLEDRIKSIEKRIEMLENQNKVYCNAFGDGVIVSRFTNGMFTVKFDCFELPIMAIKDGNGYCLSTTDNPHWHKIFLKENK